MGFLWEGSTGARAVQLLREQPPGTVMLTPDLAKALSAKQTLLHQLLANAVNLRLLKKVRAPGIAFTGWKLGAGNDGANIERRRAKTPAEISRQRAASERQRLLRGHARQVSTLDRSALGCDDLDSDATAPTVMPAWLGGAAPDVEHEESLPVRTCTPRPAAYLATWHVLYRDARGQVHGDIQVQAVHADLGVIDAWCEARGGVDRFAISGFARVTDTRSGRLVDLKAWLKRRARHTMRGASRSPASRGKIRSTPHPESRAL